MLFVSHFAVASIRDIFSFDLWRITVGYHTHIHTHTHKVRLLNQVRYFCLISKKTEMCKQDFNGTPKYHSP